MRIEEIRSQFLVAILSAKAEERALTKSILEHSGYQVMAFAHLPDLLAEVQKNPPHMVFVDFESCNNRFIDSCSQIGNISDEFRLIAICPNEQRGKVTHTKQLGLIEDFVLKPWVSDIELTHPADQVATGLYYLYENEQLLEALQSKSEHKKTPEKPSQPPPMVPQVQPDEL